MLERILNRRRCRQHLIEALLDQLGDLAFGELHDYLVDEVLSSMDARTVEALFAVAAIPRATAAEVGAVVGDPDIAQVLADLRKESPFLVRFPDGTLAVHPLLGSLLLEHREEIHPGLDVVDIHEDPVRIESVQQGIEQPPGVARIFAAAVAYENLAGHISTDQPWRWKFKPSQSRGRLEALIARGG